MLLWRAGFAVDGLALDGLEWGDFADEESRREAGERYDRDLGNWLRRAKAALEVIQAGLEATRREVPRRARGR